MVSFFQKVPRELRDQIYKELLVDSVHSINPHRNTKVKKKLCPAILRTCKQAYVEASAMLYEENVFRFSWSHLDFDMLLQRYSLSGVCLERIKKLKIVYKGATPLNYGYGDAIHNVRQILKITTFVGALRCSLKTLHIYFIFDFWNLESNDGYREDSEDSEDNVDGYWSNLVENKTELIAADDDIHKGVADLDIGNGIEITVNSCWEGVCRRFETFASKIGSRKRWRVTLLPMKQPNSSDGQNSEHHDEVERYYRNGPAVVDSFLDPGICKHAKTYEVKVIPDEVGSGEESPSEGEYLCDNDSTRYNWTWILTPKTTTSEGTNTEVRNC